VGGHGQLRARLKYRRRGRRRNVTGDETKETCVAKEQTTERSLAKRGRLLQHSLEHRLQLTRRAANNLEHIGGPRLLLKRFSPLVEQPPVLDGHDGLGREVYQQLDLLVGEWADFLAEDRDSANQHVFFEQWYGNDGPNTGERRRLRAAKAR